MKNSISEDIIPSLETKNAIDSPDFFDIFK